jgi:hypothetical protein
MANEVKPSSIRGFLDCFLRRNDAALMICRALLHFQFSTFN